MSYHSPLVVFSRIDNWLNSITMYRLVLWGLLLVSVYAIILGFVGALTYGGEVLLVSLLVITGVCFVSNIILAKLFKAPINTESSLITALIFFLLFMPSTRLDDLFILAGAGLIAMGSKYILAVSKRHIYNPAAFGALVIGLLGYGNVSWWVGSALLLPLVLVLGLLVVRKIRRFEMFFAFLITAVLTVFTFQLSLGLSATDILRQLILSSPLIFFGTIMLTEPITTPPTKRRQVIYGLLVGVLYGSTSWGLHYGPVFATPELALVVGNVLAYTMSFRKRIMMTLVAKQEIAKDVWEFVWQPDKSFSHRPGEYLEWTSDQTRTDNRGNRRYFTIASSPTENDIRTGIKFNKPSSSFKQYLLELPVGGSMAAGSLMGDFVLPADKSQELVFIAGGIGVTPFRSMIKYLSDKAEARSVVLFYTVKSPDEIAYRDIWQKAESEIGLKVVFVLTEKFESVQSDWSGETGFINEGMIKRHVQNWRTPTYYLSGPNVMVESYKDLLLGLGLDRRQIKTDYFPGF